MASNGGIPPGESKRLIKWYTKEFRRQLYCNMSETQASLFYRSTQDECSMNAFDLDVYAMFAIYNILPSLGYDIEMSLVFNVTLFLDGYDYDFYRDELSSYDISSHETREEFYVSFGVQLEHTYHNLGEKTLVMGTFTGQWLPCSQKERVRHANTYIIDTVLLTYEIFDVNGFSPSRMNIIRNVMAIAFEEYGLRPFDAKLPYHTTLPLDATSFIYQETVPTPGMLNRLPIHHPGACAIWSITLMWLRVNNSSWQMYQLFKKTDKAEVSFIFSGFVKCTLNCVRTLFQMCEAHVLEAQGLSIKDNDPLKRIKGHSGWARTLDLRFGDMQKPVEALIRVIFLCHLPELTRRSLRECAPDRQEKMRPFLADLNILLPWQRYRTATDIAEDKRVSRRVARGDFLGFENPADLIQVSSEEDVDGVRGAAFWVDAV